MHYKFPVLEVGTDDSEQWKADFAKAEKTVAYLMGYERKHIFHSKKRNSVSAVRATLLETPEDHFGNALQKRSKNRKGPT